MKTDVGPETPSDHPATTHVPIEGSAPRAGGAQRNIVATGRSDLTDGNWIGTRPVGIGEHT